VPFPDSFESIPLQQDRVGATPGTVASATTFANPVRNLLHGMQLYYGLSSDPATAPTHEGRLKKLEAQAPAAVTFAATQPSANVPRQIWYKTGTTPWEYWIQRDDLAWDLIGANAVRIAGRVVDTTATPSNGDTLVWNAAQSKFTYGAPGLTNPMTAAGDLIIGGAPSGGQAPPTRLPVGLNGQVLRVVSGAPAWVDMPNFVTNPFVAQGDLLVGGAPSGGTVPPTRLAPGTLGQILTMSTSGPAWTTPSFVPAPAGAAQGAILYRGATGWTYLPAGTAGQYLRTNGPNFDPAWTDLPSSPPGSAITAPSGSTTGCLLVFDTADWTNLAPGAAGTYLRSNGPGNLPTWVTPSFLTNPMAALGDLIVAVDAAGTPGRLPLGTSGQVLTVVSGNVQWANSPSGFADPMTTAGDMIFRNGSNVTTRLPVGTNGQVLTVVGGLPTWQTPSGGGGSLEIRDEGVSKGTATVLDFVGAGVSANVSGGVATITIPGGGGGGGGASLYDILRLHGGA
jgi:hypothetical protein